MISLIDDIGIWALIASLIMLLGNFFEHNFGGKPPIAKTDDGATYYLEVKIETLKLSQSKTEWGETTEATGDVRNFQDDAANEYQEDGPQLFPFWACEALQSVVMAHGKTKGWVKLAYIRTESIQPNRKGELKPYSEAAFKLE